MNIDKFRRNFVFKYPEKDLPLLALIHPLTLIVLADISLYCKTKDYPSPVITRTLDDEIPGVSVSTTHSEGRAIDISVSNLNPDQINDIQDYCNKHSKYKDLGAIGYDSGERRLCVVHASPVLHLHIQIAKDVI